MVGGGTEMVGEWKIAPHNGFYVEKPGAEPIYSEFLGQMLRVVYFDDGGEYLEFAVAAGDAVRLCKHLNYLSRLLRDRIHEILKGIPS